MAATGCRRGSTVPSASWLRPVTIARSLPPQQGMLQHKGRTEAQRAHEAAECRAGRSESRLAASVAGEPFDPIAPAGCGWSTSPS